jgi:predicted ATPase with chaperone activity
LINILSWENISGRRFTTIKGILPIALQAAEEGFKGIILPKQNARKLQLQISWRSMVLLILRRL